jgi:hypothetical protein
MGVILAVATLLGGLSAAFYFWEKWKSRSFQAPEAPEREEALRIKWVDFEYPATSGLSSELQKEGYETVWCSEHLVPNRTEEQGWELVLQEQDNGELALLCLRDSPFNQTLLKRRMQ